MPPQLKGGTMSDMSGRNKLRGVAHAVLGSFISRNNDIDGYWALGLLRSFADTAGVAELRFDLVTGTAEPSGAQESEEPEGPWSARAPSR